MYEEYVAGRLTKINKEVRLRIQEKKKKRAKIHQFPAKKKEGTVVIIKNKVTPGFTSISHVPDNRGITFEWNGEGIRLHGLYGPSSGKSLQHT